MIGRNTGFTSARAARVILVVSLRHVESLPVICSSRSDWQIVLCVCVFAFRGDPGHRFSSHQDVHEASQHRGQTTPVLHVGRSVCVCVCVRWTGVACPPSSPWQPAPLPASAFRSSILVHQSLTQSNDIIVAENNYPDRFYKYTLVHLCAAFFLLLRILLTLFITHVLHPRDRRVQYQPQSVLLWPHPFTSFLSKSL